MKYGCKPETEAIRGRRNMEMKIIVTVKMALFRKCKTPGLKNILFGDSLKVEGNNIRAI